MHVLALIAEANLKRHVASHRHTDFKNGFYAKVRAAGQVPESERKLQEELQSTKERLAEPVVENKQQQAEIDIFARVVKVLAAKNGQLGDQPRSNRAQVVALRPAPESGSKQARWTALAVDPPPLAPGTKLPRPAQPRPTDPVSPAALVGEAHHDLIYTSRFPEQRTSVVPLS